jgi:Tol biopolymer transport system component
LGVITGTSGDDTLIGTGGDDLIDGGAAGAGIVRVSTGQAGDQSTGGNSFYGVFSPDGTRIAFASQASNLVTGDTNGGWDLFVKDLATGAVTRVSTDASGGQQGADNLAFFTTVAFSPDSSKVIFTSSGSGLTPGQVGEGVFIKDLGTGAITLVSTSSGGVQNNDLAYRATFSPDGTKVVFDSPATNLIGADGNFSYDVFVKDLGTGAVTLVSANATGTQGDGASFGGMFSPDGARVLFSSDAANLVGGDADGTRDIFIKDLGTGAVTLVSGGAPSPSTAGSPYAWSPDGTRVAFLTNAAYDAADTNGNYDIYVRDLGDQSLTLVSASAAGVVGDNRSGLNAVAWSPDGTKIAFESAASNLVAGADANSGYDIFVKDLASGEIIRVSSTPAGAPGDASSTHVAFSSDGTQLIFESDANDLVAGDTNSLRDVFIADLVWGTNSDLIKGKGGADTLIGGAGDDTLIGGTGRDTASFTHATSGVTASLQAGTATGEGNDTLLQIENLFGSEQGDGLTGDKYANQLSGASGDDLLAGGKGIDTLVGGEGADTLSGGKGGDELHGAGGADVFLFSSQKDSTKNAPDLIADLEGSDVIDISAIDADTTKAGNQAFTLVGAFSHHAGEAVLSYDSGTGKTSLMLDSNGDAHADVLILISGDHHSFTNFAL